MRDCFSLIIVKRPSKNHRNQTLEPRLARKRLITFIHLIDKHTLASSSETSRTISRPRLRTSKTSPYENKFLSTPRQSQRQLVPNALPTPAEHIRSPINPTNLVNQTGATNRPFLPQPRPPAHLHFQRTSRTLDPSTKPPPHLSKP